MHAQRIFLPVSTSAAHLRIAGRRTLYTLHFTLYTLHTTLHTLHSIPYTTLHTTFYTLHFTHYTLHSTLHTLHCTLYTLPPPPGISIHLQPSPCGLLCLASLQLARPSNALSSLQFHHLQPQPRTSSPDISSHRQPLLCGLLCFPASIQ